MRYLNQRLRQNYFRFRKRASRHIGIVHAISISFIPLAWKALPATIRNTTDSKLFKRLLTTHFYNRALASLHKHYYLCNTLLDDFISERELTFTFAIWCYMLSHVRLSVCRLSVTSVHPTRRLKFWQCFYAIWYLGHLWPFGKNFTDIIPGEPLRLGGRLNRRGIAKYSDFEPFQGSWKRCKILRKLLLIPNRKSHDELLIGTKIGDLEWPWTA